MTEPRKIFTVGTGTRTAEEFVALLHHYGVEQAVDVRSYPVSRFPHFRREELEPFLEASGIHYLWMGPLLGGYRKGGYESYTKSEGFLRGLALLEETAEERPTAIFCAETVPWKCHRRYIGFVLAERGWEVVHIISETNVWRPRSETQLELG